MTARPEFSTGGLVVRDDGDRPQLAVIRPRGKRVLALPKGHPDPNEATQDAALREVREETGLAAEIVDRLGDVRYWYALHGERRFKVVTFFLMRYISGDLGDHDDEVDSAEWIPLAEAASKLTFEGEREMVARALDRLQEATGSQ